MELVIYVNDTDYSDAARLESTSIRKEISGRVSTASVTFQLENITQNALYDSAQYDSGVYGVDVRELNDIRLEDSLGTVHFAGIVSKVEYERLSDKLILVKADCNDYTTILDRTVIAAATFTGQSDRAILQSLIGTYAQTLTALTANVEVIVASMDFEVKDETLRQAVERLCELTGGEWRVDYARAFRYFSDSIAPAAFGLSTAPDEATTFPYDLVSYVRDSTNPINRCTVLGGFLPGGTEISITYNDPVSQSLYGVRAFTIIDREIQTAAEATLRATATVQRYAYPEISGSIRMWTDGLDVGQALPIIHGEYAIDDTFLIRSISLTWLTQSETQYDLEFGAPPLDLERLLRQIDARSRRATSAPEALPVDGSVTDASIGIGGLTAGVIGSVNANNIIGLIDAGQIGSVNAAVIAGTITSGQIGSVAAGTITGAIVSGQIGSVAATTITGAIISSQVADDLIDRLSLFNSAFRPIPIFPSAPSLPDTNYPTGSFYYNTTSGLWYENVAGTWTLSSESSAVTGKLNFYHVGVMNANSIVGLIAAGQIGSITAGQITGAIIASQISSVNASAITGSITATQISTVNASAIQGTITSTQIGSVAASTITGTITSGQIASVAASTITGTITSTQIASVAASTITGTLTSSQIGSVSAGSITGTISAGQIGSINAATITIGTIADSQVGSVGAGKITAGTISASITMTSPTLVITSGSVTVNIDATNKIKVTDTSLTRSTEVTGAHFRVGSTSDATRFTELALDVITSSGASGTNRMDLTPTSLNFQSIQVVGTRRTGWSAPTGTATRTSFATGSVTLPNLAERVKALIDDLTTHGLIGN
jgi:hypothetical protein